MQIKRLVITAIVGSIIYESVARAYGGRPRLIVQDGETRWLYSMPPKITDLFSVPTMTTMARSQRSRSDLHQGCTPSENPSDGGARSSGPDTLRDVAQFCTPEPKLATSIANVAV